MRPNDPRVLDEPGVCTYLRKGALDAAIAGYDDALRIDPRIATVTVWTWRGQESRREMTAGSLADIEAAQAIRPNVADEMALLGIK